MRIIANSTAMREVARRIERAAAADCPVVLWGEEGSGKRFVAEQIHRRSRRSGAPLVTVRLPHPSTGTEDSACLLEDEQLFGTPELPGKVAEAAGGTLLVDEITGFSPTTQARLLGAAEGRGVFIGDGASTQSIDFRLMATTRYDPAESVRRGTLRKDLHYRIGAVAIHVPPLRERCEDLFELTGELLAELCAEHAISVPAVEPEFVRSVAEYSWPGNVAQLRRLLSATLQADAAGPLSALDLHTALAETARAASGPGRCSQVAPLARLEQAAVLHALEVHEGNRTQAARSLGISVRTLQRKLRRWQA